MSFKSVLGWTRSIKEVDLPLVCRFESRNLKHFEDTVHIKSDHSNHDHAILKKIRCPNTVEY